MLLPLEDEDPHRVGPFTIDGRLGAGAHGRVYLGHTADGTAAAVRVVTAGDPAFRRRFAGDVAALARVVGDHTAALIDADPEAERPWLATEYVAGPPLTEVVAERGPLPVPEILRLTTGVAEALAALHAAGLAHRNLKPDNVLLPPEGPRVVDAGLTRDEDAGPADDVLALGELITFLATGGTDAAAVPEALRALVTRCLAPDPAARPTAAEVGNLCAAAMSVPDLPPGGSVGSPPARPMDPSTTEGIPAATDLPAGTVRKAIVGPISDPTAETSAHPATSPPPQGITSGAIAGPSATDTPATSHPDANQPDLTPTATAESSATDSPPPTSITSDARTSAPDTPAQAEAPNHPATDQPHPTGPAHAPDGDRTTPAEPLTPPANPLGVSAGIPRTATTGPVPTVDTPLAYPAIRPPANPLDLSAGIPPTAIVGPLHATGPEPASDPDPLAYPSANPPANPLDLSTGIPSHAIVGPVPAPATEPGPPTGADPLAYPRANPPANPHDLSTGIPPDAIVGPVAAPDTDTTAPADPRTNPLGLAEAARPPVDDLDAVSIPAPRAEPDVAEPAGPSPGDVIEPVGYSDPTPPRGIPRSRPPSPRPPRPGRRRLVLTGLAAVLLAVIAVPLVRDNSIPGEPVAAPATSATPATEDAAPGADPAPNCAGSKDLRGSGSALQRDAMIAVADGWAARCPGSALDYFPGGTGLGLRQFGSGEADFAVADHALGENQGEIAIAAARCAGTGAPANKNLVLQAPMVLTPIVLAYRLTGVIGLRLDAPTVAAIFDGRVTAWNDKAIVTLNAGVRLPATRITVFTRADEAPSTQTFQQYLTAVGGWRKGDGPTFAGVPSLALGSDTAIMAAIRDIEGAIGYLPYSLTRPADDPVAMIVTGNGKAAIPDPDAVHAAVTAALHDSDDLGHLPAAIFQAGADQVGDGTAPYPLVHVGYVVACTRYPDDRQAAAVRDFLLVALSSRAGPASGYQLPFGDLRDRLVEFVERTY